MAPGPISFAAASPTLGVAGADVDGEAVGDEFLRDVEADAPGWRR